MSEMIERVAAAIMDCDAAGGVSWSAAKVVAKAALEAMHEPTEAMVTAAMNYGWQPNSLDIGYDEAWRAMIDAALIDSRQPETKETP